MTVYSFVGYCRCGFEVWIEYLPDGGRWGVRFFTVDGAEIENCPECGRPIVEDELDSL